MTWKSLWQPPYMLAFVEGFLMAAIPGGGLTHAAQHNGASLIQGPNLVSVLAAIGLGLLGGIRRVQSLATPVPTIEAPKP